MNKFTKTLLQFLLVGISGLILMMTLRGNPGNPGIIELNSAFWQEEGPFELSPERGRYALLWSLMEEKSFQFSLPVARFTTPDLGYKDGDFVSLFPPGVSFILMPGYVVGKYFGFAQVGAFSIISLFALLNLILIRKILVRLGASEIVGIFSGFIFVFATPGFVYAVSLFQHQISTFLILMSLVLYMSEYKFWKLMLIWTLAAFSIPIDYPNLFLMLPIGLASLVKLIQIEKDNFSIHFQLPLVRILTFLGIAIPLAFFLWFNQRSYHNPWQFSGTVESVKAIDASGKPIKPENSENIDLQAVTKVERPKKSALGFFNPRNMLNGLYIHIFSPDRGVVFYAPIVLFGFAGLVLLSSKNTSVSVLISAVIGMNFLIYSMWYDPWGGWAFGSRYLVPSYALLTVGIGILLTQLKSKWIYVLILPVLIYSIWVNSLGALSTIKIPPQMEVLNLESVTGKEEKYTYEKSFDYLKTDSKSFFYKLYFADTISPLQYYYLISAVSSITAAAILGLVYRERKNYV